MSRIDKETSRLKAILGKLDSSELELSIDECIDVFRALNQYYSKNSINHQVDHVVDVLEESLRLVGIYKEKEPDINVNYTAFILASYLHEIYRWISIFNHHKLASEAMLDYRDPSNFEPFDMLPELSSETVTLAANMILNHRVKGDYPDDEDIHCKLFRAASNGRPGIGMVHRYLRGSTDLLSAFRRLNKKIGRAGYLRNDEFYKTIYGDEYTSFSEAVGRMTFLDIIKMKEECSACST